MIECTKGIDKMCLPDIIECSSLASWSVYLEMLYNTVYRKYYIETRPIYNGKPVCQRRNPMDGKYEHGFIHSTHEDFYHNSGDKNDRIPDLRRSERIAWAKYIIENYKCSVSEGCNNILYWEEINSKNGRVRIHLLYESERFLVVIEDNKTCYYLITTFYLDKDYALEKRLKKYKKYQKQKTPLD